MKNSVVLLIAVVMVACGGKHAVRVDCERRLVPINVSSAVVSEIPAETAQPKSSNHDP